MSLQVGEPGKHGAESLARQRFIGLAGAQRSIKLIDSSNLREVAALLRRVADDRDTGVLATCKPEHRLEAMVLRGAKNVSLDGAHLIPVAEEWPFQFPTRWSAAPGARTRYVDALMRSGDVPWALELKVDSGGTGRHYLGAIGQAVLYREFIRTATWIHPWFKTQGLDARKCQAVVAFPNDGANHDGLGELARLFDVSVTMLA